MLWDPRLIIPRTLVETGGELISPSIETGAAKASLSVTVYAYTGTLDYEPHLQAYDPAAAAWFDLWASGSPASSSNAWTFYDMNRLFPPSDLVEMYLPPLLRVRLSFSGTGTMGLAALWIDALSTRQSA